MRVAACVIVLCGAAPLAAGTIDTVAGTGQAGYSGDGGPATKATLNEPYAVAVSDAGDLYIVDRLNAVIRRVDGATGVITTVAGTGARGAADGPADRATFNGPKAVRCDAGGNVYVVDTENHSVRKLDLKALRVTTVAGGRQGKGGDGGEARAAGLDRPHGVVLASDGTLYIADSGNHRVRRVRP